MGERTKEKIKIRNTQYSTDFLVRELFCLGQLKMAYVDELFS